MQKSESISLVIYPRTTMLTIAGTSCAKPVPDSNVSSEIEVGVSLDIAFDNQCYEGYGIDINADIESPMGWGVSIGVSVDCEYVPEQKPIPFSCVEGMLPNIGGISIGHGWTVDLDALSPIANAMSPVTQAMTPHLQHARDSLHESLNWDLPLSLPGSKTNGSHSKGVMPFESTHNVMAGYDTSYHGLKRSSTMSRMTLPLTDYTVSWSTAACVSREHMTCGTRAVDCKSRYTDGLSEFKELPSDVINEHLSQLLTSQVPLHSLNGALTD